MSTLKPALRQKDTIRKNSKKLQPILEMLNGLALLPPIIDQLINISRRRKYFFAF